MSDMSHLVCLCADCGSMNHEVWDCTNTPWWVRPDLEEDKTNE